jgi:hypothetical protein
MKKMTEKDLFAVAGGERDRPTYPPLLASDPAPVSYPYPPIICPPWVRDSDR